MTRRFRFGSLSRLFASPHRAVATALIVFGAGLRVWQYLVNSSLWIDEAALARNIIDRPVAALLGPLDYAQIASPGFLLVQKAIVGVLGSSELALRLFPLACGLGGLLLFSRLASTLLEGWAAPFAIGLFAIGSPFVYFSSQMKQYSSDVLCALVLTWAAFSMRGQPHSRYRGLVLGAVGASVMWLSQPAMIMVAAAGLSLTVLVLAEKRYSGLHVLLGVGVAWVVSGTMAALVALRNVTATDREYFEWFWGAGFWPWPPRGIDQMFWPLHQLVLIFGTFVTGPRRTNGGLNYPWSALFVIVMLIGWVALWRKRRDAALILAAPTVLALVVSGLRLYPFTGRVLVFLLPSLLLATAAGAQFLVVALPERLQFATPLALALLGGAPIYAAATALPPERIEHMRPVLAELAAKRQPGDAIYVHHSAGQAFLYYAPRYDVRPGEYVMGGCSPADLREYLRALDQFRGRARVWIVATHLYYPPGVFQMMTKYLDAVGRRQESVVVASSSRLYIHGAYAVLYDLSDPQRLQSTSAASFTLPGMSMNESLLRLGCYGVESPLPAFDRR